MKNSLNHTGFSNTLIVSRKRKNSPHKNNIVIEADEMGADDPSKYCPPYMMQPNSTKGAFKK